MPKMASEAAVILPNGHDQHEEPATEALRKACLHDDSDTINCQCHPSALKAMRASGSTSDSEVPGAVERTANSPSNSSDAEAPSKPAEDGEDSIARMAAACKVLLEGLGEDPAREGLLKTPMRMAKALVACTAGYALNPKDIVADALFACDSEELVIVKDIDCFSMCEHHMLPFFGKVHIGYVPSGRVVGLSKLARLTDCFAKRLQIQERLTQQIAQAVEECVGAQGVAVVVECTHMCMTMRGVEKPGATTISQAFTGVLKTDRDLKREFLASVRGK